ncbi:hypothetical protein [Actinoplanes sp. HUAS TT8]|uniref:hypothetical protein n=1 Tax=Actinoplanes sp. HUAS TT8 TaxID=3447453 RepID=UPI003F52367D
MHELKPNRLTNALYVVVVPTLAAMSLADPAQVVLALEAAIWTAERLPVTTVIGFRPDGQPVGLIAPVEIPAGYVPVYGTTETAAYLAAEEMAHRVREGMEDTEAYWAAMNALSGRLAVSWRDVDLATERYKAALTEATEAAR